ncbi:MAG: DUF4252 domain-containing protein [Bacteroidetes bacterium]|nr:DUF4252 domain-containing protein [Bacteroidota bacterium]
MKTKIVLVFVFLISSALFAQKGDYSKFAGYINFGDFESLQKGDEVTEVLIEEHLIKMVAKMTAKSEPDLSELLNGIKLVKVNSFEVTDKSFEELKTRAEKIDKELMNRKWDRVVKTRSKDNFANVYIKTESEEKIIGLVVASVEKNGEAAFVNIVGDINLETIGRLGEKFDIPSLDNIKNEKSSKK